MERISAGRPRRQGAAKASPAPEIAPAPEPLIEEPAAEQEPTLEHEPVVPLATPEPVFAARVRPPAPGPPLPTSRRAIFYDVENASHPAHIARVIEHLAIDPLGGRTEFVAVGNWRVIGPDTARLLARQGAQLVHSAPSSGVKDWSDLRIAVSAGVWLAAARAGGSGRRRGRRGRRGGRAPASPAEPRRAEPRRHEPASAAHASEAHTAPHDELVGVVGELAQQSPNGAVLLDTLARTLKARGFSRPPGSPRLVTRLRRIKELMVSPTGMITLVGEAAHAEPIAAAAGEAREPEPATLPRRRRGRRGGRGRRRAGAVIA